MIQFTKMQGLGNDYIYIYTDRDRIPDPGKLALQISDRHFGIGSDGLVLILPSDTADFTMDMYNADGSRGRMCGNAIRCVGKYVFERGHTQKTTLTIETLSGVKTLNLDVRDGKVRSVSVDMGAPVFEASRIPVISDSTEAIEEPIRVGEIEYKMTCVSMGNPHAVIFTENIDSLDLTRIGPLFEKHPRFPDRINTEFIEVTDHKNLRMRVWERGAGETLACGTGACAALAAAVRTGRCDRGAVVHLRGGDLRIDWQNDADGIIMTGGAEFVFDGWLE